jgi:CRISPR-associated exonuclease Cas4
VLFAFLLLLIGLGLAIVAWWLRRRSGLPIGRVIYSDTGAWERNERAFFSEAYRLTGKPDYLVRTDAGIVPIELKRGDAPPQPRPGHVLQLAAYCLLVEEAFNERVPMGIIRYDDKQFAIDHTPALRQTLLGTLAAMRDKLDEGDARRDHADPRRCAACGVRHACDERLAD